MRGTPFENCKYTFCPQVRQARADARRCEEPTRNTDVRAIASRGVWRFSYCKCEGKRVLDNVYVARRD